MQILLFLVLLAASFVRGFSQTARSTLQQSFSSDLRTLRVRVNDDVYRPPLLRLGSDDILTVNFDILSEDRSYLRYRLRHCNSDWTPSQLVDSEWLDGFNEDTIEDFSFSRGTLTHYVNYNLTIPNEHVSPRLSGNYIIEIYEENNPDEILAQARFMVTEATARVDVGVLTATDVDFNSEHQQVEFVVDCTDVPVGNIYSDLKVNVSQNYRNDNTVTVSTPMKVSGRKAYFEHLRPLIFEAGNEYRRFEVISTTYPGIGVETIGYTYPYYHFELGVDDQRSLSPYLYDRTTKGQTVVREYNSGEESDTQADYVVVHFRLDAPHFNGTDLFVEGELTDHCVDTRALMNFNSETSMWEKTMLLKQGAYNYQYLSKPHGGATTPGKTGTVEGNRFQTDNEYHVAVYTRLPGERYDRLIGYSVGRINP